MTFFKDKLLTRTYCGETGDHGIQNVLVPKDMCSKPDLSDIKLDHGQDRWISRRHSNCYSGKWKFVPGMWVISSR